MTKTAPAYTHMHSALTSAVWVEDDAVIVSDDWMVFLDTSLERWEVYVDAVGKRTFISPDTWESFDGPAEVAFEDEFVDAYRGGEVQEMRFIVASDNSPYAVAARKAAAAQQTDAVKAKDRLTDLTERADALIVQAAGLNARPTEVQLQVFSVRHARIAEDMAALEAELARLRGKIALAGVALVDVTTTAT